jgi:oligopeptide transport system ATP-binding protein
VVNLLGEFRDTLGISLLFIAHDLSMVRYVSDRIIVMYLGALVEIGKADDVFFHPLHPYTRLLIASNPEADPEYERKHPHVPIKGEIPSPIKCSAGMSLRGPLPRCYGTVPSGHARSDQKSDSQGVACLLYA